MDTELRVIESGVYGPIPAEWFGIAVLDGSKLPWKRAPIGSCYCRRDPANNMVVCYRKVKNDRLTNDWVIEGGVGVIAERVTFDQFTPSTTTGTYLLKEKIPAGAVALRSTVRDVIGFTGGSISTATLTIGDTAGSPDVDRYNTGTPSVFATASFLDVGAVSGAPFHAAAMEVKLTITTSHNFNTATAGALSVAIYYLA